VRIGSPGPQAGRAQNAGYIQQEQWLGIDHRALRLVHATESSLPIRRDARHGGSGSSRPTGPAPDRAWPRHAPHRGRRRHDPHLERSLGVRRQATPATRV
jgi:hypothetical protein